MVNNQQLVPGTNLKRLKYEVASEIPYFGGPIPNDQEYKSRLDNLKFQVAQELQIPLNRGYNGELTSRQAGAIGGRLGGKIGGQMVKRMIAYAENQLSQQ